MLLHRVSTHWSAWRWAGVGTLAIGAALWLSHWAADPYGLQQAATQLPGLETRIHVADPRLAKVRCQLTTAGEIWVWFPDDLAAEAKAKLARLVSEHAPVGRRVQYLPNSASRPSPAPSESPGN